MSRSDIAPRLRVVQPGELAPEQPAPGTRQRFEVIDRRRELVARAARFFGGMVLVTLVVGLVGALALHATIVQTQHDLDQRNATIQELEANTELLRQELAELSAPERVVAEAKAMGMIEAPSIVYLNAPATELDERTLTVARNQLEGSG